MAEATIKGTWGRFLLKSLKPAGITFAVYEGLKTIGNGAESLYNQGRLSLDDVLSPLTNDLSYVKGSYDYLNSSYNDAANFNIMSSLGNFGDSFTNLGGIFTSNNDNISYGLGAVGAFAVGKYLWPHVKSIPSLYRDAKQKAAKAAEGRARKIESKMKKTSAKANMKLAELEAKL